jgi:hypothetical protein
MPKPERLRKVRRSTLEKLAPVKLIWPAAPRINRFALPLVVVDFFVSIMMGLLA